MNPSRRFSFRVAWPRLAGAVVAACCALPMGAGLAADSDDGRMPAPYAPVDLMDFVIASRAQGSAFADEAIRDGDRFLREGRYLEARQAYERARAQGDYDQIAYAERQLALVARHVAGDPARAATAEDMTLMHRAQGENNLRMAQDIIRSIREKLSAASAPATPVLASQIPADAPPGALPAYEAQDRAADAQWRLKLLAEAFAETNQAEVRFTRLPIHVDQRSMRRELSDLRTGIAEEAARYRLQEEESTREASRIMAMMDEDAHLKARQGLVTTLALQAGAATVRGDYEAAMTMYHKIKELEPEYRGIDRSISDAHRRLLDSEKRRWDTNLQQRRVMLEVDAMSKLLVTNEWFQYPPNWIQIKREADERMERLHSPDADPMSGRLRGLLRQNVADIDFLDTPLEEALEYLQTATDIPVNIVAMESARLYDAYISMRLTNVTLEDSLNWISTRTGLEWVVRDGEVRFYDAESGSGGTVRRLYDIVDLLRRMPRPSGADPYGILTVAEAPPEAEGDDEGDDDSEENSLEEIFIQVLDIDMSAADSPVRIWRELMIAELTPEKHLELEELLQKMRAARNLQVHVAARFVRINSGMWEEFSNYFDQINTDPNFDPENPYYDPTVIPTGPTSRWQVDQYRGEYASPVPLVLPGMNTSLARAGSVGAYATIGSFGWLNRTNTNWFLSAAKEQGMMDVMLSPHILTYNNERGAFTKTQTYTYLTGDANERATEEAENVWEVGVRPVVSADRKYIYVDVTAAITNVTFEERTLSSYTGIPYIVHMTRTEEDSQMANVISPNGGTVLVSGMSAVVSNISRTGTPILMDIPVLGNFVSSRAWQNDRVNRLLMVTSNIIDVNEEEAKASRIF